VRTKECFHNLQSEAVAVNRLAKIALTLLWCRYHFSAPISLESVLTEVCKGNARNVVMRIQFRIRTMRWRGAHNLQRVRKISQIRPTAVPPAGHASPIYSHADNVRYSAWRVYRKPRPANDNDLQAMRRTDLSFTARPWARRIARTLMEEGLPIDRKCVRLMRLIVIEVLGRKPRASKPALGHKILTLPAARSGNRAAEPGYRCSTFRVRVPKFGELRLSIR
jgi:hypothetical protein